MPSHRVQSVELSPGALALGLLRASEAMNRRLLELLADDGWPELTRHQSLVFANLDADGTTAADLARRVGITRQSMQKLIESLLDSDLVELRPHPDDARSYLIHLSKTGRRLMRSARSHLAVLERHLEHELGKKSIANLRSILAPDWSTLF